MTQKNIKKFVDEYYSKGSKKTYSTNKTDDYHIDDIWLTVILDLKGYGPENNRVYIYVLVIINGFSKIGWTDPLKKNAKALKESFENSLIMSKRKPKLFKSDRGGEYVTIFFKIS